MNHGADVEIEDNKGFTPLFHASKHGSLPNLLELLERGNARTNHYEFENQSNGIATTEDYSQRTALCVAKTTESVQMLLNFGATTASVLKTAENKTTIDEFLEKHSEATSNIILNECLEEINEDLIVFNFEPFEDTKIESNEMDLHKSLHKNGKTSLLLHPIMKAFLDLKWQQVKRLYFFFMCFEIAFVLALSFLGFDFVRMTFCNYCGEKYLRDDPIDIFYPRDQWKNVYGDDVPPYWKNQEPLGQIKCFIRSKDDCDNDEDIEACNNESENFRKEYDQSSDFCNDVENRTTEEEDCFPSILNL